MKTVFTNFEVPHEWAKENPDCRARNSGGSFSVRGLALYSYATEIARLVTPRGRVATVAFFSEDSHSPTTGKQITYARRAVNHLECFDAVSARRGGQMDCNPKKVATQYAESIYRNLEMASRARTQRTMYLEWAHSAAERLNRLVDLFQFAPLKAHKEALEAIKKPDFREINERYREANKKRAKAAKAIAKKLAGEQQKRLALWREGIYTPGSMHALPVALRLIDDGQTVETSHGAKVPLEAATVLFNYLKRGKDIVGANLNGFIVRAVNAKHVQIGCHKIPLAEVEAIMA